MKQLQLRVNDELHARLIARAQREQKSVNALANDILSRAMRRGTSSRQQVRARAAALSLLATPPAASGRRPEAGADRQRVLDRTRGLGPVLDRHIDDDRDRR